ncbi:MAG TPA: GT4 family glycosyltransferase PelF [Candidatus Acutalibacter pullistercoris]|uniref:GT4 family glycosyltransferase PelF n=1 Tax=Candidatus Acutalibacter pullistercoris TaxID=2838418 RepID=A0A9D1YBE6_9FIRM|nr:GT4 family glycosyltransferase PelF [Candidatus Acutalibacter pullistercoris]
MKICLIAEGCYPYVAGGVSSWVQMLMEGMPQHQFVLYTIGAEERQRGKFKYKLPENLVEVHENFLDQYRDKKARHRATYRLQERERKALVDLITKNETDWDPLFSMFGEGGAYSPNEFLSSDAFLDVVMGACEDTYRLTPFNEVFWTIRSMLLPVLNILRCPVPEADMFHTVSTGYAGILGAMFQYRTGKPFIVTEHGIYSREREEEILKASWVYVYFKQTWINFFLGMASAAYAGAVGPDGLPVRHQEVRQDPHRVSAGGLDGGGRLPIAAVAWRAPSHRGVFGIDPGVLPAHGAVFAGACELLPRRADEPGGALSLPGQVQEPDRHRLFYGPGAVRPQLRVLVLRLQDHRDPAHDLLHEVRRGLLLRQPDHRALPGDLRGGAGSELLQGLPEVLRHGALRRDPDGHPKREPGDGPDPVPGAGPRVRAAVFRGGAVRHLFGKFPAGQRLRPGDAHHLPVPVHGVLLLRAGQEPDYPVFVF